MHTSQESEVLHRRLDAASSAMNDALKALDTKDAMMRWLDIGTRHLSLLLRLGQGASEVRLSVYKYPMSV